MMLLWFSYRAAGIAFVFKDHLMFLVRKTRGADVVRNLHLSSAESRASDKGVCAILLGTAREQKWGARCVR